MIAQYRPIGRRWGWLSAGLLLALAVTGLTDAADPGEVEVPSAATEQAGDGSGKAAEPVPKPIADAIAILRKTEIREVSVWGSAIRDLARIGKPAVPYLVAELDRTNSGSVDAEAGLRPARDRGPAGGAGADPCPRAQQAGRW